MNTESACRTKVWDNVFGSCAVWIVQASQSQTPLARKTAGGVLRLLTLLERYPQRILLQSAETTPAFVDDATYPGSPLLRRTIPNRQTTAKTPWPDPVPEDALLIVDTLNPRLWPAFQVWRGDRAALVIFEVDDHHGWIPPGVGHWVLNVSSAGTRHYHPPTPDELDSLGALRS